MIFSCNLFMPFWYFLCVLLNSFPRVCLYKPPPLGFLWVKFSYELGSTPRGSSSVQNFNLCYELCSILRMRPSMEWSEGRSQSPSRNPQGTSRDPRGHWRRWYGRDYCATLETISTTLVERHVPPERMHTDRTAYAIQTCPHAHNQFGIWASDKILV